MFSDYYDVLGVPSDASLEVIQQAYRTLAQQHHPDRGGSHEKMKQLNLAFFELSDPGRRAAYDRVRAQQFNPLIVAEWDKQSEPVRQRAAGYPRKWEDFEKWMDGLVADVQAAQYGSEKIWADLHFPTVTGSVSGYAFIGVGLLLGAIVLLLGVTSGVYSVLLRPKYSPIAKAILLGGPLLLGAWGGQLAHKALRRALPEDRGTDEGIERHGASHSGGTAGASSSADIVTCLACGRKLRVPRLQRDLVITCPTCKNRFEYRSPA